MRSIELAPYSIMSTVAPNTAAKETNAPTPPHSSAVQSSSRHGNCRAATASIVKISTAACRFSCLRVAAGTFWVSRSKSIRPADYSLA